MKTARTIAWVIAITVIGAWVTAYFQEPRHAYAQIGNSTYPAGAIAVTNSATGSTAAVATLPASPGRTTYICGFQSTTGSATTAGTVVVTGTVSGSLNYTLNGNAPLIVPFTPCVPATGVNTTIVVTGAYTTGAASSLTANGYQTLDR